MTAGALAFLIGSWTAVLGLAIWSYGRILRPRDRAEDADGAEPSRPQGR
jgi:hypothetical protein